MIAVLDLTALLLTLCALFGWFNRRFLRLPNSIGLLTMGLFASLLLVLVEVLFPGTHVYEPLTNALKRIDFTALVMDGMLAFLLFAGALNVDLNKLKSRAWPIAMLALLGTVVSTIVVGFAFWAVAALIAIPVPLSWALVFGALISPTDPIAVLAALKNVRVPKELEVEMQGEALFNDGVGVVIFTLLVGIAIGSGGDDAGVATVLGHLGREAIGGLLLGTATGYLAYRAMHAIDDFAIEVLITLALVTATYALARVVGVSGPLSVVAAGLLIGYRARRFAMSDITQRYITALWTLIDEVLNAILFLLIGLEVVVINFDAATLPLAALAIPIVLVARLVAVSLPLLFDWTKSLSMRNVPFLTWAGVRGGISVALALSLPADPAKPILLTATYAVVLFTIIVQGSTLGRLASRTLGIDQSGESTEEPAA